MIVRARAALAIAALVCPAAALAAGDSAQAWFSRMQQALSADSYSGIVVYLGGNGAVTYRMVACSDGIAKLTALSGPAREILRGPNVAVRRRANGATMVVDGVAAAGSPLPFPPATQTALDRLGYYKPSLAGWDRVAGQSARVVALVPRDRWRYGYRVWIDENSGLPLRSELLDENGQVIQQAFFTQIGVMSAADARVLIGGKAVELLERAERSEARDTQGACPGEGISKVDASDLPPGFQVINTVCERAAGAGTPVTHVLIGDGLATVSVFLAPHHPNGAALVGGTALGSVHAVGRVAQGVSVTAMGDAPFPTIARIARGIVVVGQ